MTEMLVEVQVKFDLWIPQGFGTSDCIIFKDDGVCHVIDYKHGSGVKVYAEHNPQGMLYGLGVIQEFGFIHNIKTLKLTIVQPRLDHIDEWEISREDLLAWGEEIKPIAELAMTDVAPLNAGEKQCQFCRAKLGCRARAEMAMNIAQMEFDPV